MHSDGPERPGQRITTARLSPASFTQWTSSTILLRNKALRHISTLHGTVTSRISAQFRFQLAVRTQGLPFAALCSQR